MKEVQHIGMLADEEDYLQLDLERVMEDLPENKSQDSDDSSDDTDNFQIDQTENQTLDQNLCEDKNKNENSLIENIRDMETFVHKDDVLDLKDYSDKMKHVEGNSTYVEVLLKDGSANRSAVIKKSSFCWLLSESNGRISNDRLKRFIITPSDHTKLKAKKSERESVSKINPRKSKQKRLKKGGIGKFAYLEERSVNAKEIFETAKWTRLMVNLINQNPVMRNS